MSEPSDPRYVHRARVAALSRSRAADDPDFIEAKRDLAAANIAAEIQHRLAGAPPLTPSQVETLTSLLRSQGPKAE